MISNNQKDVSIKPEVRVQEIYKLIQQGQNFESLAKQFSDDKSSAKKGGKLSPFTGGQLSSALFEDVAFSLNKIGEVSEPFQSDYGWHIIKLYNNKPIASLDEMKYELENKVRRDARSKLINTSLQNKLKKQYNISSINSARSYFVSILNDNYYNRAWKIPSNITKEKPLLQIGDTLLTYNDFATFLYKRQKAVNKKQSFQDIVDTNYEFFINTNVLVYHEQNLENENIEFAQILSEYREGLLLFDLMETKIWNAVKKDTLGIQNYYNANKNEYKWEQRIDALVATSTKEKDIKVVEKMLKEGSKVEEIKTKLNQGNTQKVIFTSGIMTATHRALPKVFDFTEGISKIYFYNDAYHIIKVNKLLPEANKTLEEVKGNVISDYQDLVEKNWIKELEGRYKVKVNQDVLAKVKSQINN
jgi:peptidyl-prolyl cis-trans isomerase SurA